MKRFLFPGIVAALMLAACQDATRPVAIQKVLRSPSADLQADASPLAQFAVRADPANDVASAEDLSAALAALGGPTAAATSGSTECVGLLIGAFDKVEVPPGATCTLANSTVAQWVKADAGSGLLMFNTRVGGNVMGLSPRYTQILDRSHVEGSVHIDNAGDLFLASCALAFNVTIDGNFHCNSGNPAAPRVLAVVTIGGSADIIGNFIPPGFILQLQQARIGNTAHVSNNSGTANFKVVNFNTVSKTLVCENNDLPFIGGPNTAARAQGQCF